MRRVDHDTQSLLETDGRVLARNERYTVFAVRIENAALARASPVIAAFLEAALAASEEAACTPRPRT